MAAASETLSASWQKEVRDLRKRCGDYRHKLRKLEVALVTLTEENATLTRTNNILREKLTELAEGVADRCQCG